MSPSPLASFIVVFTSLSAPVSGVLVCIHCSPCRFRLLAGKLGLAFSLAVDA